MNLRSKKELAARTFDVGKERILFVKERLDEVKEAITKQDMKELYKEGVIKIKEVSGRKNKKNKKSRSAGNIRKRVVNRKKNYVIMTRKLRRNILDLKLKGNISPQEAKEIRKKIRNKVFKSKAHMKEYLEQKNKLFATPKKKNATKKRNKK
jgi:large subunit ribosomal protein L19e